MPTITYAQALNEALREEMRVDARVFLMGEDIGHHGGIFRVTKDLIDEFGADRVRDTPISESSFVGLGIGAAMAGMRPVVELLFMDFALVAADQIVNQAAKLRSSTYAPLSRWTWIRSLNRSKGPDVCWWYMKHITIAVWALRSWRG